MIGRLTTRRSAVQLIVVALIVTAVGITLALAVPQDHVEGSHGCTLHSSWQENRVLHGPNHWHASPGVFHTRTSIRVWQWYAPSHIYVQTLDVVDEGYPAPPGWWTFESGYGFCS